MIHPEKSVMKKNIALSALGISLQLAGSICLFAAALGVVKQVNLQIKRALLEELTRQVEKR